MSKLWLKASLRLWRRRQNYARKRHNSYHNTPAGREHRNLHIKWKRRLNVTTVMVHRREKQLRAKQAPNNGWNPVARKVIGRDAGTFMVGNPKIVWHTTEGSSVAGAIGAYKNANSWPHFTLDSATGDLVQHVPINRAARALAHPAGTVETNRAHAIQIELVGFAKETHNWTPLQYRRVAKLARWIEQTTGVKRQSTVRFDSTPARQARRMSPATWIAYNGHCGHGHVPGNQHWDPGQFKIADVLR